MASNFLYIVAPDDMDSDDTFQIWSDYGRNPGDFALLGDPVASEDRGDGNYSSYSTTLAVDLDNSQINITLTDATNFANGDYVFIGKEGPVLLGGKSGDAFATCTRGPIPLTHDISVNTIAVYRVTPASIYEHEDVDWGSGANRRFVIRYLVRANVDGTLRSGAPVRKFNPPDQPDNSRCYVYGVMESAIIGQSGNGILVGETVTATIDDGDNYLPTPGVSLVRRTVTATTDLDGFWYLSLPRARAQEGADTYTLVLAAARDEDTGQEFWRISSVPDQDSVHFMAITEAL